MANAEIPVSDTAKCVRIDNQRGDEYMFYCPGCQSLHSMTVNGFVNSCGASWTFNGDVERPTFSPSLKVTWDEYGNNPNYKDGMDEKLKYIIIKSHNCHSFINNGMMSFCGDSTHKHANKTLEIPAFKSMK